MEKRKVAVSSALIVLISVFIINMNIFEVFSQDKLLPHYIKIGLFFDKTAKSTLLLESETFFEVGIFDNDKFIDLFDLDKNKISLKKDEIHSGSGTTDSYHIQVGQDFGDYTKACVFLESLKAENIDVYLYYDGKWKVYTGPYMDKADANQKAQNINADLGYKTDIIRPSDTGVRVVDEEGKIIFLYDSSHEVYFTGKSGEKGIPLVNVEGTKYRGGITAKRLSNSDMTIINKLPLEEYLYGVVPSEMPALWPKEALKAQAVAARGFAVTGLNKYRQFDFNLCTTTSSQVYKGYSGEHTNTNNAVDETKNMVITYNGKLIEPYYHADSGGYTENSENVWTNSLPYIRGVKDDFSSDTPYSNWSVSLGKGDIKNRLADNNIFIGDILDIKTPLVSDGGRVLSLVVHGTEGEATLEKEKSRFVFGLKSSRFTINSENGNNNDIGLAVLSGTGSKPQSIDLKGKHIISHSGTQQIKNVDKISIYNGKRHRNIGEELAGDLTSPNVFIFNGSGYGHGLGMSQYGARNMAVQGFKHDEILAHYYTGIKVEHYENKRF